MKKFKYDREFLTEYYGEHVLLPDMVMHLLYAVREIQEYLNRQNEEETK
jgi:hypothetical protein